MSVKSDKWIKKMAEKSKMINPFSEKQIKNNVISYGLSSYGYDMRIASEFKIFKNIHDSIIDPKKINPELFEACQGDICIIPPNSIILARSVEYFNIPRKIITICLGKSTYARCGVIVNVTPFEPEWEGYATLEISNTAPAPVKIYANEGIAQIIFLEADEECLISYKDKAGKYQAQDKIVYAKI
ncbi:MAG: dCTP deaminase [Armatimonadetes bacterium]|nr:dCTP deaminase [Armatimonadota bacterium]